MTRRRLAGVGCAAFVAAFIGGAETVHNWIATRQTWEQRLTDEMGAVQVDQTALNTALAGQDRTAFLGYCHTDVAQFNTDAAQHAEALPAGLPHHLDPKDACQP